MVKPSAKRQVVGFLQNQYALSQRSACRLAGISRQAMACRLKRPSDTTLKARLKQLGEQYPRYGYLMLHAMLRTEGLVINRKTTYRVYIELGMQVRTKKRKKLIRPRVPMALPALLNERW